MITEYLPVNVSYLCVYPNTLIQKVNKHNAFPREIRSQTVGLAEAAWQWRVRLRQSCDSLHPFCFLHYWSGGKARRLLHPPKGLRQSQPVRSTGKVAPRGANFCHSKSESGVIWAISKNLKPSHARKSGKSGGCLLLHVGKHLTLKISNKGLMLPLHFLFQDRLDERQHKA